MAISCLAVSPAMALAATGPVAAYGFDEASGTTVTDSSSFGNTGVIDGATRVTGGKFGGALSFDGTNDRVRVPDSASLDLTTGMTLEAWVNPRNSSGWHNVMLKERTGDLTYALYASGTTSPSAQLTTATAGDYRMANGLAALPTNTWSHLAATYDGTTLRLLVNGAVVTSTAYTGTITVSNGDFFIGGNSVWGEWFDGLIDEVRVYDHALTTAEIQADMATAVGNGATPTPTPTATPTVTFTPTATPTPTPPPDAATKGTWTPPVDWPLVAVHMSMLSNGKVAMWDAFGAALGSEKIWDPATGLFQATPSGINLFCAGHVLLPDGRLFTAGGHVLAYVGITNTALLNPLTGSWTQGPQMSRGRWYPTTTTLPDGRVLIVSGDGIVQGGPYTPFYAPSNTVPEIYNPATNTIAAMPSAARQMPLYPFIFVAPDGRVVDVGPDKTTRFLDLQT
ncbi:MAG TPA: LamG-like jellyroll fold domain-containing protein, partial [Solirubrobacter sp.]